MKANDKFAWTELQQQVIDRASDLPRGFLKNCLKKIDKDFSVWLKDFESICTNACRVNTDDNDEESVAPAFIDETVLPDLLGHISNFQGFDIEELVANIFLDVEGQFNSVATSSKDRIINNLTLDFWKVQKGDFRSVRIRKKLNLIKVRLRLAYMKLFRRTTLGYGTQSYEPDLLISYYLTIPAIKITIELIHKRMQEYARYFNYLHDMNDNDFRYNIGLAVKKFKKDENSGLQNDFDLSAFSQYKIIEKPSLSSTKDFSKELNENLLMLEEKVRKKSKIAGTFLLDESVFDISENERSLHLVRKDIDRKAALFNSYYEGEGKDWIKDLEIITFQWRTITITETILSQLHEKVSVGIVAGMDKILDLVKTSFDAIKEGSASQGVEENILKENRSNLRSFRQKHLPEILDSFQNAQLIKTIENFGSQIAFRHLAISDEFSILQKLDFESLPPETSIKNINLKKIFGTEYLHPLQTESEKFVVEARSHLDSILRTLNEIGQMIQFNLETAMELKDEDRNKSGEDVEEVLTAGLDRVYSTIQKVKADVEAIPDSWGRELTRLAFSFIRGVNELLDNENITNLLIRQAKAEASQRIKEIRLQANKKRTLYFRYAWKIISFGMTGARTSIKQLNRMSGAAEISESQRELMNYLISTQNQIEKLPFIYQRLYRFEPLNDTSIFVQGSKELDSLNECFELWRSGNFASVAIIGEKGSGRTSLVNIARTTIFNNSIHFKVDVPKGLLEEQDLVELFAGLFKDEKVTTFTELENALNGLQNRVVIIVENLQNMFIRTVNGFNLIEGFLLLISRLQTPPLWVITCGMYMWNYLDSILKIKQYFYNVIPMGQFDAEQLREMILIRHRMSGYGLEFIPSEDDQADKKYKKLNDEEARQRFLEANFFEELDDICKGNISIALLLWQLCVENIKQDRVVVMNDLGFQTSFLGSLDEIELFTLQAIVEMEVLSIDEHSKIFNVSRNNSELILLRMKNKGLLKQIKEEFQIHFLLYKQVLRVLDAKNILK